MTQTELAHWLTQLDDEKLTAPQLRAVIAVTAGILTGQARVPVSADTLSASAGVTSETAAAALRRLVRSGVLALDPGPDRHYGYRPGNNQPTEPRTDVRHP